MVDQYWKEIATVLGFGALWFKSGRDVGNFEQKVLNVEKKVDAITKSEYCTKEDCESCREQCQQHTWDKFLLAIEKRDREFDRKFSQICQGITEIKSELKR